MYGNGNVWGIWWLHNKDMRISSKWSSTSYHCYSRSLIFIFRCKIISSTYSESVHHSLTLADDHSVGVSEHIQRTFKEHSKNTQRTLRDAWGGRGVIFDPPKKLLYSFVLKSQNHKYLVMNFPNKNYNLFCNTHLHLHLGSLPFFWGWHILS